MVSHSAGPSIVALLLVLIPAGLGLVLSLAGLISILVSNGTRRGFPYAIGGLLLSGAWVVVVPALFLATSRTEMRTARAEAEQRMEQQYQLETGLVPRPQPWPKGTMVPTVEPDPFQDLWPTTEDPLPEPFRLVKIVTAPSSSKGLMESILGMAHLDPDDRSCFDCAAVLNMMSARFTVFAFKLRNGKDYPLHQTIPGGFRATVLGRAGAIRVTVICESPNAERDADYLKLVDYFKSRMAKAKLDSW